MSALAQLLQGKKLTIEDKSPGDDAVDMTPPAFCDGNNELLDHR
jgi:hypothetical protein